ncbi:anaerobic sulfatase maturase [Endozoicomonas sp. OPT23]|uniref:anaerobic sulfatase maturase n=1 Tax=Endozoicomonas sp. OPT23 TaxID=2072845 RepID=UPI00129AA45A|nr:anaerobic sulfatase maturase [Endozoicomonas sp. OPT23]MRI32587.1 anaerobic sulfatase maturase [Endozoicomonas sp. OPT23]
MRPPFHLMAKPTSYQCNLDCDYCFYLEKQHYFQKGQERPKKDTFSHMSDEVLKAYIKQYIQSQDTPVVEFAWQGGEPTTAGLDFFKKAIQYQRRFANGKQINNSLQTNGVLINDDWCRFLKQHNFLVGISIDGPKEFHDHYRLSQGGKPTFDKVMAAIERMKQHKVEFNTLTVLNDLNIDHPHKVYQFLKGIGSTFLQFIPIVEQQEIRADSDRAMLIYPESTTEKKLMPFSADGKKYGDFMVAVFDEWVRKDVGKVYVQMFDCALTAWYGHEAPLCIFRKECGKGMVIERNGDLYSCDHYVYPEYYLGNILEEDMSRLANQPVQSAFGKAKADDLGIACKCCEFRFACNGGCPKHRIHDNADGSRQNHLCAGYKKFFRHVSPYMDYMVKELRSNRAPASIMYAADRIALQASA